MTQTTNNTQAETLAEQLDVIRAGEKASDARQTAHSVSEEARARADAYRAKAGQQASDAYEAGQEAVRKNPVLAVGIALGAGVLLGRSVLRRF